jgi:hypothetical protein
MNRNEGADHWNRLLQASSGSLADAVVRENIRAIASDAAAPERVRMTAASMLPQEEAEKCVSAA